MSNFLFRLVAAAAAVAAITTAADSNGTAIVAPATNATIKGSTSGISSNSTLVDETKGGQTPNDDADKTKCECESCIEKIFFTVLITIGVWSPIAYILSYKWIKFTEEIEANAAYEVIRQRSFELIQQQHGQNMQYDSFIGCPVHLFNERHGPPQIDPNNPPPPTTIAQAIQRKINQMVETSRGGGAPH